MTVIMKIRKQNVLYGFFTFTESLSATLLQHSVCYTIYEYCFYSLRE